MKKIGLSFLAVCLMAVLLTLPMSAMAEVYGTLQEDVPVYSGPSEKYTQIPEILLRKGAPVTVRTKYYNGEATWLQVEFSYMGVKGRGYVPGASVAASLSYVPKEAPLCAGKLLGFSGVAGTGPVYNGYLGYETSLRPGSSVVVYEVEDSSALVECWHYDEGSKCRVWVALGDLSTEMSFAGTGYYGVAEEDSCYVPSPTRAPSTYYGSTGKGYPVGKMVTVVSGSCHVKREPDPESQTVNYAYVGDRFEVLECVTGSTGKDWYRIKINGAYGWISSGLVSLD